MNPISLPETPDDFRTLAPAFADPGLFPDLSVMFWMQAASMLLNATRWGSSIGLATVLFVQHNLALEAQAQLGAAAGGIPGLNRGVIASSGAKALSVGYDTGAATVPGAAHWNLTTYGTRFIFLSRLFGAGPVQLGTGFGGGGFWNAPSYGYSFGPGWWPVTFAQPSAGGSY